MQTLRSNQNHPLWPTVICALFTCVQSTLHAQASLDRIYRRNGTDSGEITAITPQEVTISKGGVTTSIPSEEVRRIYFAGEPAELNQARVAAVNGQFQEARKLLNSINTSDVQRDEISQDIEFYSALCAAKLALAGQGDISQAGKQVAGFRNRHRNSYHLLSTFELLGDLLVFAQRYEDARLQYDKLESVHSPYYKLRSALLVGRSYQDENKHGEALREFDHVLQSTDKSPAAVGLRLEALLGKAVSQAATGAEEEAITAIDDVLSAAKPKDDRLHARAYNALGNCYQNSGNEKAALYAFLHTHLLYNEEPQLHAKALHEITQLWQSQGRPDRAREAQQQLDKLYPGNR